jgi:SIT family siderophore-iron:H+ symporter-like MFS transporter
VVGIALLIAFVFYERLYAPHPLIPFALLANRTVIICFIIALLHPIAGRIVSGYYFTFLLVAAEQTNKWATRLSNIGSFSGTVLAVAAGFAVRYTRRIKYVVIFGFICQVLGTGLMIRFRTSTNSKAELAAVQVSGDCGSWLDGAGLDDWSLSRWFEVSARGVSVSPSRPPCSPLRSTNVSML